MSEAMPSLKPEILWRYFERISQIPRGSGNEAALGKAIVKWSEENGCTAKTDDVGNVIVSIPATPGCESKPTIVLQSHMDMVHVKNRGTVFNFEKDPIRLMRDGDWITAHGTTLGADNGIGLAAALAFMELEDPPHGPIEILATVEEETGLTGAASLSADALSGRLLFNLDSEEDSVFYAGCAGGSDMIATVPVTRVSPKEETTGFLIEIGGLTGGHSGLDVIHNRANANILMARTLRALWHDMDIHLSWIVGGDKHNAIPTEAAATIMAPMKSMEKIKEILQNCLNSFQGEFDNNEPKMTLTVSETKSPSSVLDIQSQQSVVGLLIALPNGVKSIIRDIPGVVETSNNVARVRTEKYTITVLNSARSSVKPALDALTEQIRAIATLASGRLAVLGSYPGWKPNMSSPMLAKAKQVWRAVHDTDAEVHVVHAGLECGLIGEKFSDMDMISLGPTIENAHSPDERVSISSTARFFEFLRAFVASYAKD